MGARWDPNRKKWFATNRNSYPDFKPFFQVKDANCILLDSIYILKGPQKCPYCGTYNTVLTSGHGYCLDLEGNFNSESIPEFTFQNSLHIIDCYTFDNPTAHAIYKMYGYNDHLFKFCDSCNNCIPNFHSSDHDYDFYTPFRCENLNVIRQVELYRIKLQEDLAVYYYSPTYWCSLDDTFLQECKIINL